MRRGEVERGSKTALVTGASTGIGRAYVEELASLGYNLVIVSRDEALLQKAAAELAERYGVGVTVLTRDLACETAGEELFGWVKGHGFEIDVLVNNAGMFSFVTYAILPLKELSGRFCCTT